MKKLLIVLIILIIIGLGISPFFLTQTTNNILSVGTNVVNSLASIITLSIALLLYSKYGIEKSFINKQTEVVSYLLTELKKTRFLIFRDERRSFLQLFLDMLGYEHLNEYRDQNLVFSVSYLKNLNNIWEITENIFLPREIVEKIRPLMVQIISKEETKGKFMIVAVPGKSEDTEDGFYGKLNGKDISLREFMEQWTQVIEISKKWLNEHSNMKIDFNFERF